MPANTGVGARMTVLYDQTMPRPTDSSHARSGSPQCGQYECAGPDPRPGRTRSAGR